MTLRITLSKICNTNFTLLPMDSIYTDLTRRALDVFERSQKIRPLSRVIIVLAGPPGSGKSTVAAKVVSNINNVLPQPIAAVLPMDGFHYSRAFLNTLLNHEEAHERRGAHWTFDAKAVVDLVRQLHASRENVTDILWAPSFDHKIKDPVPMAIRISPDTRIVIVEGNWLLYDQHPWNQIVGYADDTWFVDVEPHLALQRVAARHLTSGIEKTLEAALDRARNNDMRNGEEVRSSLIQPKIMVKSVEDGEMN